ncbi:hypothetical protein M9Y10_011363 [Tritrichomonas musculus]|uniref:Uncharacterized protein n=1 Tax=Tritrichomonas musculus TaxID=1915356 RepID=A0ABR2IJA1_9EUKA
MKKCAATIKKPLMFMRNTSILPRQYHQNFRSSSVFSNPGYFSNKMAISSTTSSFPCKTFQMNQNEKNEEKSEDDLMNSNQNDILLNTNPNYDDIIFGSNRIKPTELFENSLSATVNTAKSMQMKYDKFGTVTAIVGLPRMIVDQDQALRARALQQRKELLEILETDNLPPSEILHKISTYATPYSKLLKLAFDELQYATVISHSTQVDDLERNAAVTSAKKEIEVQQLTDKAIKLKNECADLKKSLKKSQNRLQKLNSDIEILNKLTEIHGIDIGKEIPNSARSRKNETIERNESEKEILQNEKDHAIPLDDALYKSLWSDHTKLLDEIEDLQKQLTKTQEKQAEAYHETALRLRNTRRPSIF